VVRDPADSHSISLWTYLLNRRQHSTIVGSRSQSPSAHKIDTQPRLSIACLIPQRPAAAVFSVDAPPKWPDELKARVVAHFKLFRLARLYGVQAAAELQDMNGYFSELISEGGSGGLMAPPRRYRRQQQGYPFEFLEDGSIPVAGDERVVRGWRILVTTRRSLLGEDFLRVSSAHPTNELIVELRDRTDRSP
jgi:hypothetical protein